MQYGSDGEAEADGVPPLGQLPVISAAEQVGVTVRVPSRACHPLVLPPSLALLLLALGILLVVFLGASNDVAVGWVAAAGAVSVALALFYAGFFLLGSRCWREEGPKPNGRNEPYQADFLPVGGGSVGMGKSPGRKRKGDQRDLRADLARLRDHFACDLVITMLDDAEMSAMCIEEIGAQARAFGMDWIHLPVRDKWVPHDTAKFLSQGVVPLVQALQKGRRVLVHCNGGKGRTGTLVAAALLTQSLRSVHSTNSLADARRVMRGARGGMLKNPLQGAYVVYLGPALAEI